MQPGLMKLARVPPDFEGVADKRDSVDHHVKHAIDHQRPPARRGGHLETACVDPVHGPNPLVVDGENVEPGPDYVHGGSIRASSSRRMHHLREIWRHPGKIRR